MGLCTYCGKPAGILSTFHPECKYREERKSRATASFATKAIPAIRSYIAGSIGASEAREEISNLGKEWNRGINDLQEQLCSAWGEALEGFLEDGMLDEEEEGRLQSFIVDFDLSTEILQRQGHLQKAMMAKLMRQILNAEVFSSPFSEDSVPFNLQKNEIAAWVYPGTRYLQEITKRSYVGGSAGASVRVAKGVYLRKSAFRGYPVDTRQAKDMGTGTLVLTTKNIYWGSPSDSLKIPYAKIISFSPCDGGIVVCKDGAKALPQTFITGDGWGTYNLAVNLAKLY